MVTDRQLGRTTRKVLKSLRFLGFTTLVTKITLDLMTFTITGGVKILWLVSIYPSGNTLPLQIVFFVAACAYGASCVRFYSTLYNCLWNNVVTRAGRWLGQYKIVKRKA